MPEGGGKKKIAEQANSTWELPLLVCGRLTGYKHIPRDKPNLLEKWAKDRCVGLCLRRETLEEKKNPCLKTEHNIAERSKII